MKTLMISEDLYNRAVTLKKRHRKLSDLFMSQASAHKKTANYLHRCLAAEHKCRIEMGIILGVCI